MTKDVKSKDLPLKVQKFNWKAYLKDFQLSILAKCFTIGLVCYIILTYLTRFLNENNVNEIGKPSKTNWFTAPFEFFPETHLINFALAILLVYSVRKTILLLRKNIAPVPVSLCIGLTFAAVYYFLIRRNPEYDLHSYAAWGFQQIKHYDMIVIFLILQAIDFKSYTQPLKIESNLAFTEDQPGTDYNDEIGNQGYAEHIANYINSTTTKASFAIGIMGEWGSGKTDFLKRLHKILSTKQDDNLLIEFNPWRASKQDVIVEDFFNVLSSKLKPFSRRVSNKIKTYSTKILQPGKEIHYRIVDTLLGEVFKTETNQERYDNINSLIESTGKRIIVFIDDLDRLNGNEIFEVLRIIRNTANFSNTFFVVAMDETYITDALIKTSNLSKEGHYLKKIFQYSIVLPKIRKEIFPSIFKETIKFKDLPQEDQNKIDRILNFIVYSSAAHEVLDMAPARPESYFESLLDNIRDVKRFSNSFKTSFNLLNNEVETLDLALLELVKVKSIKTYEAVANRTLVKPDGGTPTLYTLNTEYWDKFKETLNLLEHEQVGLKNLLLFLFKDDKNKSKRKFVVPKNFHLYFSYQLVNLVSISEFIEIVNQDWKSIANKFAMWKTDNKQSDLLLLLNDIVYDTKEDLIKIVKALVSLEQQSDIFMESARIILAKAALNKKIFSNIAEFREDIIKLLNDSDLQRYKRAIIANNYVKDNIHRGVEDYGMKRKELIEIIFKLFKEHLEENPDFQPEMLGFYLLNDIGRTSDDHVIINPKANKLFKEYIINGNFEKYFRYFIRSHYQPNIDGIFTFDPFYRHIFDIPEELKGQIEYLSDDDPDLQYLKQIALANLDKPTPGAKTFQLNEVETRKMLKYLNSNGQYNYEVN